MPATRAILPPGRVERQGLPQSSRAFDGRDDAERFRLVAPGSGLHQPYQPVVLSGALEETAADRHPTGATADMHGTARLSTDRAVQTGRASMCTPDDRGHLVHPFVSLRSLSEKTLPPLSLNQAGASLGQLRDAPNGRDRTSGPNHRRTAVAPSGQDRGSINSLGRTPFTSYRQPVDRDDQLGASPKITRCPRAVSTFSRTRWTSPSSIAWPPARTRPGSRRTAASR